MKKTLFKKNDIAKILLIAFGLVGFSSYVFSAPPPAGSTPNNYGVTPGTPGYIADIIDFSIKPQAKDCVGGGGPGTPNVLARVTLSLCHKSRPSAGEYAFGVESITSSGPITAQGKLIADLSQMVGTGGAVRDVLRLTTGKNNNITTISINKPMLGVWSDYLNTWANGRFGRLDAEKLILSEKVPFGSFPFGPLQNAGLTINPERTQSYTTSLGALPNIDIAGTTNLGQGNYCYRQYRDCSGGANSPGGGNMYINRLGRNYTSCRDIDPAEYPQVADMSDPGFFTCGENRVAPPSHSANVGFMPTEGYSWVDGPNQGNSFCQTPGFVANQGAGYPNNPLVVYMLHESAEDTFGFGTYVFKDPYLERPIEDGWHPSGGISPIDPKYGDVGNTPGAYGISWYKTAGGSVVEIGKCFPNTAPTGNYMVPYPNATNFWIYNSY